MIKVKQNRAARYVYICRAFAIKIEVETIQGWTISLLHMIIHILEYFAAKYGDQNRAKSWRSKAENFSKKCSTLGSVPNLKFEEFVLGDFWILLKNYLVDLLGNISRFEDWLVHHKNCKEAAEKKDKIPTASRKAFQRLVAPWSIILPLEKEAWVQLQRVPNNHDFEMHRSYIHQFFVHISCIFELYL